MYQDGAHAEPHSSHVATNSDCPTVESPHCVSAVLLQVALDVISAFELQP